MWPEALVRTRDSAASPPAMRLAASNTLVRYEQANGVCLIGHPMERDAFVDQLVALSTSVEQRTGEPSVLALSRWSLGAIEIALRTDLTRAGLDAAFTSLSSAPEGPAAIVEAMIDDGLLVEDGPRFSLGPALDGWQAAFDGGQRLEIQRLDIADGPQSPHVTTMTFLGAPGERWLVVPQQSDEILVVRPTVDEATALIDATLTPSSALDELDDFSAVVAAWRDSADALIARGTR